MKRRRIHGHRRRKSSCKPSPLKHKEGEGWAHDFKTDAEYHKDDSKKEPPEAVANPIDSEEKWKEHWDKQDEQKKYKESNEPSWWERNYGKEAQDAKQDVLTLAGTSPGVVGMGADAANTIISGGRTIWNALTGNWSEAGEHLVNTGLNALSFVPGTESVAIGRLSQSQALANTGERIYDQVFGQDENKSMRSKALTKGDKGVKGMLGIKS